MSILNTVWSKTILMSLMCILACNAPLQAFSATEQLGKLKDFVVANPKESLIGAGIGCLIGLYVSTKKVENIAIEEAKYIPRGFVSDEELKIIAYHEAGHALVGMLLPNMDPLDQVTIVMEGSALGMTWHLTKGPLKRVRTGEQILPVHDKDYYLATITMKMGGRAAESLACGNLYNGVTSDFAQASEIARNMVCNWGMSQKLGPVIYNPESAHFSEHTRMLIDQEVQSILEQSLKRATDLLIQHRDKLDTLAHALLEKETLSAQEVYELLGMPQRAQSFA